MRLRSSAADAVLNLNTSQADRRLLAMGSAGPAFLNRTIGSSTFENESLAHRSNYSGSHADGTRAVGLHELLSHASDGTLIDLPGMRADQRPAVVTTLAIISHLLRRYSKSALATADEWLEALHSQFGEDALVLVGGADNKPQFLQPVLVGLGELKPFNITETDHLMAANRHVLKVADEATPEVALFSLMASTWRHNGGVGNPAGARSRLLTVLVGDGVTITSEIDALAAAYAAITPSIVGTQAAKPESILEHMLWAQPWQTKQPVTTVPFPFIDCRRIRLVPAADNLVSAIIVAQNGTRVDTGTGNIDDPHVPIQVSTGGPYKLALNRVWSYRVHHAAVAGSEQVSRPRILDLAPAYTNLRINGVGFDQGVTKGSWEALYRIARGKKIKLGQTTAERLSNLSSRALGVVHEATGLLYGPMLTLYGNADSARPYLDRAQSRLRDLLGHQSLQVILDLVAEPPDTQAEQQTLQRMAVSAIRVVWRNVTGPLNNPLLSARASLQLNFRMQDKFGEYLLTDDLTSNLGARVHAVLYDMDNGLTPANRASIRSAATELPLGAWLVLAATPKSDMDDPKTRQVWEAVVRALGVVRQGGPGVGAVLAETDYPEARISSLLTAHGETLVALIAEAVRWLVSHEVERCTLTDIVVLGIADARSDSVARDEAISRIALGYARAKKREQAAA